MKFNASILIIFFISFIISCNKKDEKLIPLSIQNEIMLSDSLKEFSFSEILKKNKSKNLILIDIWASWCADCIKGMDELKQIQAIYKDKNITFLMLSVDEDEKKWRNAINKFQLKGSHYLIKNGWKTSDFCNFLDVNWIPRYVLLNNKGEILYFRAITAGDKKLISAIETNLKN